VLWAGQWGGPLGAQPRAANNRGCGGAVWGRRECGFVVVFLAPCCCWPPLRRWLARTALPAGRATLPHSACCLPASARCLLGSVRCLLAFACLQRPQSLVRGRSRGPNSQAARAQPANCTPAVDARGLTAPPPETLLGGQGPAALAIGLPAPRVGGQQVDVLLEREREKN